MTEIAFHVNAPDKLAYACRLLRKALRSGTAVVVTGEQQWLNHLNVALWTFSAVDFLPHCFSDEAQSVVSRSPIVLTAQPALATQHSLLVNAGIEVAQGFERFERVIELADQTDSDVVAARLRWKHYAGRGYPLKHQDLAKSGRIA